MIDGSVRDRQRRGVPMAGAGARWAGAADRWPGAGACWAADRDGGMPR